MGRLSAREVMGAMILRPVVAFGFTCVEWESGNPGRFPQPCLVPEGEGQALSHQIDVGVFRVHKECLIRRFKLFHLEGEEAGCGSSGLGRQPSPRRASVTAVATRATPRGFQ